MRKYLVIGVSLFLLALISLNVSAITASQLGANQIVNTYSPDNWAGVAYSVEWWTDGIFNHWGVVQSAWDYIYVGNLSLYYVSQPGYSYPDVVGIWVALSPAQIGYGWGASSGSEQYSFVQAGYNIQLTSTGNVYLQYFVTTINNKKTVNNYETTVPGEGQVTRLGVYLLNQENGTVWAEFWVIFANGSMWAKAIYVSIPWTLTYSAMNMVETPQSPSGGYYELPYISGGMINFGFEYVGENGYQQIGPSTNPSGTIYADVYQMASTYNSGYAQINNGWAYSGGGWSYLYQFTYPWLGDTTYGL